MAVGTSTYQAHGFHESLPKGKASGLLTVHSQTLRFQTADHVVSMPLTGAQFKLGGASDRLLFASHASVPDWSVYTSDLRILKDPHLKDVPMIKRQLSKARNKRLFNWSLMIACVFVVVLLPILFLTNMDWLSAQIAEEIPADWEVSLGETTYAQTMIGAQQLQTDDAKAALAVFIQPLLSVVDSERYEFQVAVTNTSDVNAFALPGGFIVINAGLILEADSANEVLGVLAHEISHVTEQHGLRNIISTAGVFLVVDALLGDVSGVLAMLTNAAPLLINQSYSRQFESEADEHGVAFLEKANIDPNGFITFFEKLIELEQERLSAIESEDSRDLVEHTMGFLSTHPATQERIEHIKTMIVDHQGPYKNYDAAFLELKAHVKQLVANQEDVL